jgi:hypothetical protein
VNEQISFQPKSNGDHSKKINDTDSTHTFKKRNADSNHCEDSQPMKKCHTTSGSSDNASQRIDSSCNNDDKDEEEDEYAIFGNYVADEIRSLHSEENRRDLKRIIQKAIIDMAELDDRYFQPSTTCNIVPPLTSTEQSVTFQECSGN